MASEKNLMIRLKAADKEYLRRLALQRGESMTKVVEHLLEDHRRRSFFGGLSADYANLRKDSSAWEAEQQEQRLWDTTLADGLEDE